MYLNDRFPVTEEMLENDLNEEVSCNTCGVLVLVANAWIHNEWHEKQEKNIDVQ